jgi:hypothetical protein
MRLLITVMRHSRNSEESIGECPSQDHVSVYENTLAYVPQAVFKP